MIAPALTNDDAEQSVLGAALMDEACIPAVRTVLQAVGGSAAFYRAGYRPIWDALCALVDRGERVDPVTLSDQLAATGDLELAGGKAFIGYLVDAVPTAANAEYHAAIVAKCATRRRVCQTAADMIDAVSAAGSDPATVASGAVAELVTVATAGSRGAGFVHVRDVLFGVMTELEQPAPADGIVGVPTGWREFDDATGGMVEGEVCVFAAEPGGAKTVSLANVAIYNALGGRMLGHTAPREPIAGGFVSAEMTKAALVKRSLCSMAEIDTERMRKRRFVGGDFSRLATAAGLLAHAPLFIDDTPAPTLDALYARCRGLKARHPEIRFLCVDYLQLIRQDHEDNRAEEIREVAKQLKAMAKELHVALFTAAQLNDKDMAKRAQGSRKPTRTDVQGSSGVLQAADVLVLQYRPLVSEPGYTGADIVQMDGTKNREMRPFFFSLDAELQYQRLVPARAFPAARAG